MDISYIDPFAYYVGFADLLEERLHLDKLGKHI